MELPANNISQKLFNAQLQNCVKPYDSPPSWKPSVCCLKSSKFDSSASVGDKKNNGCLEDAFVKQCLLSQHYKYLSKNNSF